MFHIPQSSAPWREIPPGTLDLCSARGGDYMSERDFDWWNKESSSDALLRRLVCKAEELGRLPTKEEIERDASLPSLSEIAMTCEEHDVDASLSGIARLLYKHGTKPVDLTASEQSLPDAERKRLEQEHWNFYQTRLARLKRPGGLKKLRQELQADSQHINLSDNSKVVRIPIQSRRSLQRTLRRTSHDVQHGWNSAGFNGGVERRKAYATQQPDPNSSTPQPDLTPDQIRKAVEQVAKAKIADHIIYAAAIKLKEYYGVFPGPYQISQYRQEHPEDPIPSFAVFERLLGKDRQGWQEQIDKFNAQSPAPAPEEPAVTPTLPNSAPPPAPSTPPDPQAAPTSPDSPLPPTPPVPSTPSVPPDSSVMSALSDTSTSTVPSAPISSPQPDHPVPLAAPPQGTDKVILKMNIPSLTVNVQINGQSYQVDVEFGPATTPT